MLWSNGSLKLLAQNIAESNDSFYVVDIEYSAQ